MMDKETHQFIEDVRAAAVKLIDKVESGRAQSVETYADMLALRAAADRLLSQPTLKRITDAELHQLAMKEARD
jgi:hypothetical protein